MTHCFHSIWQGGFTPDMGGLLPVFLIAAFFESFVTRHYQFLGNWSLVFILSSLAFVTWYFIIYPYRLNHGNNTK